MQQFIYVARKADGSKIVGEIEARNRNFAIKRLFERKYAIISLEEVRPKHWIWSIIQPVRKDFILLFIRQMSVMLAAGIPVLRVTRTLLPADPGPFRKAVERVYVGLATGFTLSQALRRSPEVFSPFFIGAVRLGEASGRLSDTLEQCAGWLEAEHAHALRLRAALIYPAALLFACLTLVIFIFTFMIPRFVDLFMDLRMELPWLTATFLKATEIAERWGPTVVLTGAGPCLAFGYLFYLWSQTSLGKITLERWSLRLPLYGRQIRYRMMSRFLRSSATLMNSGVPLGMAFAVLEQSLDRELLRVTVRMQADAASHGLPIAYGMQTVGLFPPMVLEMVVVAEETGTLPRTLERLASFYDQEMAIGLTDITKFIEVAVVTLLGGAVAVLLLAAFMPIYQLTASF